jgi:toxin ParE1/3/4
MRLVWTEPALADLDLIADYIALDNAQAAAKLAQRVFAAAERLIVFPKSGRPVPELKHLPYRELVVPPVPNDLSPR